MRTASLRRASLVLFLGFAFGAHAGANPPASSAAASATPAPAQKRELPELPKATDLDVKEPSVADVSQIDELLTRIAGDDQLQREEGVRAITELGPRAVPALRRRLEALSSNADKNAMKTLLLATRKRARDEPKDKEDVPGSPAEKSDKGPDYFQMVLADAKPGQTAWKDLVRVLALSRMFEQIGTTPAVRGLCDVYVRFGDFMRIDTQKALARLGDRAVPALLETRRHQAERIGQWAARQLDMVGRAAPSQAAQITDPAVLADVLRAYGRTKDLDAARIVISFAGSERAQLRDAARQAIGMLGEAGHWQLRDAYEDVVGKRAQRDWTWERTARELFYELDRLRRAELLSRFEAGQKAQAAGDLDAMRTAFDEVLARVPFFERADEMVGGYWEYAKKHAEDRRDDAIIALRRAERLSRGAPHHDAIESLLLTLEAERLEAAQIIDRNLLKRAVALDPTNTRAKQRLDELSRAATTDTSTLRYGVAGGIALGGILGVLFVLFAGRLKRQTAPAPASESAPVED